MDFTTSTATVTKAKVGVGSQIGTGVILGIGAAFLASYLMAGLFFFQGGQKPFAKQQTAPGVTHAEPLLIADVHTATLNTNINADPGQDVRYLFSRENVRFGVLHATNNAYDDYPASAYNGRSPFDVGLVGVDQDTFTYPARLITVTGTLTNGSAGEYTLCVPETTVERYGGVEYFYDTNGTPYTDALLAHAAACGGGGSSPSILKTQPSTLAPQ